MISTNDFKTYFLSYFEFLAGFEHTFVMIRTSFRFFISVASLYALRMDFSTCYTLIDLNGLLKTNLRMLSIMMWESDNKLE